MNISGIAIHGLGVVQPIDQLADYINQHTSRGIHLEKMGGIDPEFQMGGMLTYLIDVVRADHKPILIGHSKGAMACFYLAKRLELKKIDIPLIITYDTTDWGSNFPTTYEWTIINSPTFRGMWRITKNVKRWIHFRQPIAPGGGVVFGDKNILTVYERREPHISLPIVPFVRDTSLQAIRELIGNV